MQTRPDAGTPRLIVDASTLVRWWGPPVGIVRVEAEIVRYVLDHEPEVVLSVYDPRVQQFRPLDRAAARALADGRAVVDVSLMPDPRPVARSALRTRLKQVENRLRPLLRIRRTLASAADGLRRRLPPGRAHQLATLIADALLTRRVRARVFDADGARRDLYRIDKVLGPPLTLSVQDIVFSAGADWGTKDPSALAELKRDTGCRFVMLCHDLIPIIFPRFYMPRDVEVFSRFFQGATGFVDRFICISQCTAADLAAFARAQGRDTIDFQIERLGVGAVQRDAEQPSTPGLEPGRYVLYVSTIEPRKNHAMLLRAWKRLAEGEQGGTHGYKLVVAGRTGWMTDDVLAMLTNEAAAKSGVVHFGNAQDAVLDALYEHAAFCVYPSLYEGFGLPVIEAFAHGRPVIASAGGAVPEAAAGLAPCVDPKDEDAWVTAIGRWLGDPQLVDAQARRVREQFSWPSWPEAARRIVATARQT